MERKGFILIAFLIAIFITILLHLPFQKPEKSNISINYSYWPMFKHDVYRTGNLFFKELEIKEEPSREITNMMTIGSNAPEGYERRIIEKDDSLDPSPIFVDLDSDGTDEVISYYKNTVYNITTRERPFKDFIMAVKYKENPSLLEKLDFGGPFVMKWKFLLPKEVHTSFAAGDLNKDGYPEIAFGCDDGNLYVLNKEGKLSLIHI